MRASGLTLVAGSKGEMGRMVDVRGQPGSFSSPQTTTSALPHSFTLNVDTQHSSASQEHGRLLTAPGNQELAAVWVCVDHPGSRSWGE